LRPPRPAAASTVFQARGGRRIESVAALLETIVENVADTMDRLSERIAPSSPEARPVAAKLRPASPAAVGPAHRVPPVTGIFGMNTKGLPFTDLDTAFLWASLLMVLSSFAAYLIMKRIGIIK
jgi:hypothetical protein